MKMFFLLHSGFRYVVLLALVLGLVILIVGWLRGQAMGRRERILCGAVIGCLDLQMLLGLVLLALFPFYPALGMHAAMMLTAVISGHVFVVVNKKRESPSRAIAVLGLLVPLILILGGILSISRPILGSGGFAG